MAITVGIPLDLDGVWMFEMNSDCELGSPHFRLKVGWFCWDSNFKPWCGYVMCELCLYLFAMGRKILHVCSDRVSEIGMKIRHFWRYHRHHWIGMEFPMWISEIGKIPRLSNDSHIIFSWSEGYNINPGLMNLRLFIWGGTISLANYYCLGEPSQLIRVY